MENVEILNQSSEFVQKLMFAEKVSNEIEKYGSDEIKELGGLSNNLKVSISELSKMTSEGNSISKSLIDLKLNADKINPSNFNLNPGWFGRIFGNNSINKYVTKFNSTEEVIQSIVASLQNGKETLEQDIIVFEQDKERFTFVNKILSEKVKIVVNADRELDKLITEEKDEERKKFLQNDISFTLKQRILDLQQTSTVAGQGVISLDILIKNNKELIKCVNRTTEVTVPALRVAATVLVGLSNQKQVLDTMQEVNKTTDDILVQTSNLLFTQGTEIQKQASSMTLNVESLKTSINKVIESVESVETFRIKALPEMSKAISTLDNFMSVVDKKIERIGK